MKVGLPKRGNPSALLQFECLDLVQEVPDETSANKIIKGDFPPKPPRFLCAVDPAIKTDPYFTRTCKYHGR
jgi:hypothetical protein